MGINGPTNSKAIRDAIQHLEVSEDKDKLPEKEKKGTPAPAAVQQTQTDEDKNQGLRIERKKRTSGPTSSEATPQKEVSESKVKPPTEKEVAPAPAAVQPPQTDDDKKPERPSVTTTYVQGGVNDTGVNGNNTDTHITKIIIVNNNNYVGESKSAKLEKSSAPGPRFMPTVLIPQQPQKEQNTPKPEPKPTLTRVEIATRAQKLADAANGLGTDEKAFLEAVTKRDGKFLSEADLKAIDAQLKSKQYAKNVLSPTPG